ncbi:MAG: YHS domain-containing protein [Candidatus Latescibacterota bacterium]|jgi:YHS domain-containing protein
MLLFSSINTHAAEKINTLEKTGFFSYEASGTAIRGTDTVAYFTQGKPVKGSDKFTTEWQGATWKFASQEHLDLFFANPEKYAPQFGGYCAYGVFKGQLVKIEPENWTIVDDKLYLNFNGSIQNTWEKDTERYIQAAGANFHTLLAQ